MFDFAAHFDCCANAKLKFLPRMNLRVQLQHWWELYCWPKESMLSRRVKLSILHRLGVFKVDSRLKINCFAECSRGWNGGNILTCSLCNLIRGLHPFILLIRNDICGWQILAPSRRPMQIVMGCYRSLCRYFELIMHWTTRQIRVPEVLWNVRCPWPIQNVMHHDWSAMMPESIVYHQFELFKV